MVDGKSHHRTKEKMTRNQSMCRLFPHMAHVLVARMTLKAVSLATGGYEVHYMLLRSRSEDMMTMTRRHVPTFVRITVGYSSYGQPGLYSWHQLGKDRARTGSRFTKPETSAGYRARKNSVRTQALLSRRQRKANCPGKTY